MLPVVGGVDAHDGLLVGAAACGVGGVHVDLIEHVGTGVKLEV